MKLKPKSPDGYAVLLNKVKATLIEGQRRIEQERVRAYWETGRLIHTHLLNNKDRAQYGAEVVNRLANDLNVHARILQRCVQFSKVYPHLPIVSARTQLVWTHYRELITVTDGKKRVQLEAAAIKHAWSTNQLADQIKKEKQLRPTRTKFDRRPLTPLRGKLHTRQLIRREVEGKKRASELLLDLGFGIFRNIDRGLEKNFTKDEIVELRPQEGAYKFYKSKRVAKDLYTYAAFVERVIDGDSFKVRLDLGCDTWARQTLRLRAVNCPEIKTKEGKAAKAFVLKYIKEAQMIIVRSSNPDKYDRYLADIFIPSRDGEIYLNNLLLEKGHAVRVG